MGAEPMDQWMDGWMDNETRIYFKPDTLLYSSIRGLSSDPITAGDLWGLDGQSLWTLNLLK